MQQFVTAACFLIPSKVKMAEEQEYSDFFLSAVWRGSTLNTFMELLYKCSGLLLSQFHQLNSFFNIFFL